MNAFDTWMLGMQIIIGFALALNVLGAYLVCHQSEN
jgi:hypothetical protein